MRCNCSILDLHDRSIVASITDKQITSDLAVSTLKKAIKLQQTIKENLILHSDQESQYTSKEFTEFCKEAGIIQSMSRAGCSCDNVPMERYYNTLKNELTNLHHYHNDDELNEAVSEFASIWYNYVRQYFYKRLPYIV